MEDTQQFNKELDKINELIYELGKIADSDGEITTDEQRLLDKIMSDLSDYRVLVLDVMDDNKITADERNQMKQFRQNILDNANSMALVDGSLSEDESSLIDSLIDFVGDN